MPRIASAGASSAANTGGSKRKPGALVRQPVGEHARRDPEPLDRPEHRLVREVDDELGPRFGERRLERVVERDAVVRARPQLLGAAGEPGAHDLVRQPGERVADDGRVVLPVDHGDRAAHDRVVTSFSIRAVYFSKASVSVENWMIRSCPWNGYLRQTETCLSSTSITL